MARSTGHGITYFSMDVDLFSDRKIRRLMYAHGMGALTVVVRALCAVYSEKGYYAEADDDFYFDLAHELGTDEAFVRAVIGSCAASGFFDSRLFGERGVLTSRRIQRNYADATKRRDNVQIDPALRLIEDDAKNTADERHDGAAACNNGDNACNNPDDACTHVHNVCNKRENAYSGTQSKVNQNKQEESKPHQNSRAGGGGLVSQYVTLSKDEHERLKAEFGEAAAARMVEMLGSYKGATGKQYKSDYCAIKGWVQKRWREENMGKEPRASFERPVASYDHLAVDLFAEQPKPTQ